MASAPAAGHVAEIRRWVAAVGGPGFVGGLIDRDSTTVSHVVSRGAFPAAWMPPLMAYGDAMGLPARAEWFSALPVNDTIRRALSRAPEIRRLPAVRGPRKGEPPQLAGLSYGAGPFPDRSQEMTEPKPLTASMRVALETCEAQPEAGGVIASIMLAHGREYFERVPGVPVGRGRMRARLTPAGAAALADDRARDAGQKEAAE